MGTERTSNIEISEPLIQHDDYVKALDLEIIPEWKDRSGNS